MAAKKVSNDFNAKKFVGALFVCLVIWWILLTIASETLDFVPTHPIHYILSALRIGVPVVALLFGIPLALIANSNKNIKKKKK